MNKIIQWNCRGCVHNASEIKLLIQEHSPMCLVLQETHFKRGQSYSIKDYSVVRNDFINENRACGGVAIFLRNDVFFTNVNLASNLQVLAVKIHAPINVTLCNVYLPNSNWNIQEIQNIEEQLQAPYIFVGDFNAHNTLWGSTKTDSGGHKLETWLNTDDIALLSTGSPTHFNEKSNSFSAIDLSFATYDLLTKLTWKVDEDLHNSDHYPIIIELDTPLTHTEYRTPIRWNFKNADWQKFSDSLVSPTTLSLNEITNSILTAATISIPKTS